MHGMACYNFGRYVRDIRVSSAQRGVSCRSERAGDIMIRGPGIPGGALEPWLNRGIERNKSREGYLYSNRSMRVEPS
jgi:hypothetical protein